ncbi:MAG: decarboxylase [Deltaproteobacteria bacterium]|jgi:sulfopyruvate decarboxylase TPP-binding subunit|nr:decarboxylase [Deltaproteobacteria bacterium]MBI3058823.1 decarboxylase [Deltaproteobacteria bacterium]
MDQTLKADEIVREVKRAGIRIVVALPDRMTSEHLLKPILRNPDFRVLQVCKEDEGISICSGLYCADQRALLLIQYTGLLDSMNALSRIAVEGQNPVCMMVGLLGKEPGVPPAQSKRYGLRIVVPILDVMGIEHHLIESSQDVSKIAPAVERAYANSMPVALLVGREPA